MNDFDLEAKLKGVPLPERPEDYWENFPAQVRFQLHRAAPEPAVRESWLPQFVWKMSVGLACLAIGLLAVNQPLRTASRAIFKNEQMIRQQLAQLPNHLRTFMADEHGLHYLIAEKE
jgi:hypothetical protein